MDVLDCDSEPNEPSAEVDTLYGKSQKSKILTYKVSELQTEPVLENGCLSKLEPGSEIGQIDRRRS